MIVLNRFFKSDIYSDSVSMQIVCADRVDNGSLHVVDYEHRLDWY